MHILRVGQTCKSRSLERFSYQHRGLVSFQAVFEYAKYPSAVTPGRWSSNSSWNSVYFVRQNKIRRMTKALRCTFIVAATNLQRGRLRAYLVMVLKPSSALLFTRPHIA